MQAVHLTETMFGALAAILPEVRVLYLGARILATAGTIYAHWEDGSRAYHSVRVTLDWLEATWPGLGRAILTSALRRASQNLDLVEAHFAPDFGGWLVVGLRITRSVLDFGGATDAIHALLDVLVTAIEAAWEVIASFDFSINVDATLARTREELQRAFDRAHVEDAVRWAETIARSPRGTIERLVTEVRLLAPAYSDLSQVVAALG
jgi:hypothetical protein